MSTSPLTIKSKRIALFEHGFPFVPVETGGKKPLPGGGWQLRARALTAQSAALWPDEKALNTGIICDALAAVDIDSDDAATAEWIERLALERLGPAPIRFRANSPRRLLLYAYGGEGSSTHNVYADNKASPVVEIRGEGLQCVVDGLHPSGVPHIWNCDLNKLKRADLRVITSEQLDGFLSEMQEQRGWNVTRTQQRIEGDANQQHDGKPTPSDTEQAAFDSTLKNLYNDLRQRRDGELRNKHLFKYGGQLMEMVAGWGCDGPLVESMMFRAMEENGAVHDHGVKQFQDSMRSAYNAGMSKPRARMIDLPLIDIRNLKIGGRPVSEASQVAQHPKPKRSVVLTGLAGVQETSVEWLWPGYLPAGMLTLLSGNGGTGKSTLAFSFAATITTGSLWPDGKPSTGIGNVLIWSSEDDIARTIKPRLMAAGADINRIAVIESTSDEAGKRIPFDPATDMESLRDSIRQVGGISLLIIDPIVSAVNGDMHKANDVRRSLQPIVDLAAELNCAVLGITHFAKNTTGRNASERVIGSQAFAALARMVLVTAKEEDSDARVFTRAKSNISEDEGGLHYTIEPTIVKSIIGLPIQTTRVVWGDAIQGNARAILSSVEGEGDDRKPLNRVEEGVAFLRAELTHGPVAARDLIAKGKQECGLNERTLQRARERLGIVPVKSGFQGAWMWSYRISPQYPDPPASPTLR